MVLHEKGIEFEDRRLNLNLRHHMEPEYLAINPNGVVPTLVDDGVPIIESSVICEYLDEKYPQTPLMPTELVERAHTRAWMHYIEEIAVGAIRVPSFNRSFLQRFDGLDQRQFEEQQINVRKVRKELFQRMGSPKGFTKAEIDRALEQLAETCRRMDAAVAKKGPWLMGDQFTLADILVTPTIDRLNDLGLSDRWAETYPNLVQWYRDLQERLSFKATFYPGARLSENYQFRPLYAEDRE
jgi:glutathione S-transferase